MNTLLPDPGLYNSNVTFVSNSCQTLYFTTCRKNNELFYADKIMRRHGMTREVSEASINVSKFVLSPEKMNDAGVVC